MVPFVNSNIYTQVRYVVPHETVDFQTIKGQTIRFKTLSRENIIHIPLSGYVHSNVMRKTYPMSSTKIYFMAHRFTCVVSEVVLLCSPTRVWTCV